MNPLTGVGLILILIGSYFTFFSSYTHRESNTKKILDANKNIKNKGEVIFETNRFLTDLREFKAQWSTEANRLRSEMLAVDNKYMNKNQKKWETESEKARQNEIDSHDKFLVVL